MAVLCWTHGNLGLGLVAVCYAIESMTNMILHPFVLLAPYMAIATFTPDGNFIGLGLSPLIAANANLLGCLHMLICMFPYCLPVRPANPQPATCHPTRNPQPATRNPQPATRNS